MLQKFKVSVGQVSNNPAKMRLIKVLSLLVIAAVLGGAPEDYN